MENFIRVPLNLPETRVLEVTRTPQRHRLIRVESTKGSTLCRRCGRQISDLHSVGDPVRLRHLPLFEVPVYVEIRPKRYRCRFCLGSPTTPERCSGYDPKSPNTRAYEEWLLRLLVNSTEVDTARKLDITKDVVEGGEYCRGAGAGRSGAAAKEQRAGCRSPGRCTRRPSSASPRSNSAPSCPGGGSAPQHPSPVNSPARRPSSFCFAWPISSESDPRNSTSLAQRMLAIVEGREAAGELLAGVAEVL